jgi:hypothetical protein
MIPNQPRLPPKTLFALPDANPAHPAKYTDILLTTFARMLRGRTRILDPFGGTGKVFLLAHWLPEARIEAVEIEPEWAAMHPKTTLGNALHLPWEAGSFDAVCTSPTYGNRMADGLRHPENWAREYNYITYSQKLNRDLAADNSGAMQWGDAYRAFHVRAWTEARRVLVPGAAFVLNIKDHVRAGVRQHVTDWHSEALGALGFRLVEHKQLPCPGMRYGRNGQARIEYESVIAFELAR